MIRIYFILCLLTGISSFGQSPTSLKEHLINIKSIDPADDNFSDLMPLIEKIGAAKVVALGEATHEDGATFKAKARLIKFLHQKMGFDVLLWESGALDNYYMNTILRTDSTVSKAIQYESGGWGGGEYGSHIFEYARQTWKTNQPIEMGGFDLGAGRTGAKNALSLLNSVINKNPVLKPPSADSVTIDSLLRGLLNYASSNNLILKKISKPCINAGIAAITKIINQMKLQKNYFLNRMGQKEYNITFFFLKNILDEVGDQMRFMAYYLGNKFDGRIWNTKRDSLMAERLFGLMDKIYAGRKVILWGATGHFMRNSKGFISRDDSVVKWNYYQMGDYVSKKLGSDYYVIGFTSFSGQRGDVYADKKRNDDYGSLNDVPVKVTGSFEEVAHQSGLPYSFIDLRTLPPNHWLKKPAIAYPFGNTKDKTDWSKMLDAFFFIDAMEPEKKR